MSRDDLILRMTTGFAGGIGSTYRDLSDVWTTGEIRQRPEPEGRSSHYFVPEGDCGTPVAGVGMAG